MSTKHEFHNVHWLVTGGNSCVYEVHRRIVLKVPKPGQEEKEQFRNEVKVLKKIFSQQTLCPYIVQCFLFTDNGIFSEYMHDWPLYTRITNNQITDNTMCRFVLEVKELEPLDLRKVWMHDLTRAVAFLESLNLAHGDLQPGNIFMHGDRIKLSDFDCTAEFGESCGTPGAPYGRLLNSEESHLGERGCLDPLGVRTEQFALGSVFYFINYGFEVYGDRSLTENPYDHGPKVIEVLQQMQFPKLGGDDEVIDDIIDKCWHYKYAKIADLVKDLEEKLRPGVHDHDRGSRPDHVPTESNGDDAPGDPGNLVDGIASVELNGHDRKSARLPTDLDRENPKEDYDTKRAFCQDLVSRGLVDKLSSKDPEELDFTMEWYRYSS